MDVEALPKISADAHVNEPHDLWAERLPEELRAAAPQRIQANDDGGWQLIVNGEPNVSGGVTYGSDAAAEAHENREREAAASVEARLEMMHGDRIHAEMVYPTIGLYVYGVEDSRTGIASCQVYNDWIREKLLGDSPRVQWACLIPAWDTDSAIAEVQRVAGWKGVGAVMLPLVGTPSWNMPEWEPLWSAIDEVGLPIVMHQGTGHDMLFFRGWGSPTANLLATQAQAANTTALLSCSGVLERHPDLHFVLVEVNAGWLPWTVTTLDEYFVAHGAAYRKPHLPELPSFYIRRQIHATFQRDPIGVAGRDVTGVECLMWGNDFPHMEGTYPDSHKVIAGLVEGVDVDDAARITGLNALEVFGFDESVLDAVPGD